MIFVNFLKTTYPRVAAFAIAPKCSMNAIQKMLILHVENDIFMHFRITNTTATCKRHAFSRLASLIHILTFYMNLCFKALEFVNPNIDKF